MRLPRALEDLQIHGDYMELFHEGEKILIKYGAGCDLDIYFNSPMCYFLPTNGWEVREVVPEYKTQLGQEFM